MTFRFAAARTPACSPVARALSRRAVTSVANDNSETDGHDEMLHAALRQFSEHGFGAARTARRNAEEAFFTDDMERYHWWLGVCRKLDRRMALELEGNPEGEIRDEKVAEPA